MGNYCSQCGEPRDDHLLNHRTGDPTVCPDVALSEGTSPDGHVKMMNGERTGRYANGSY